MRLCDFLLERHDVAQPLQAMNQVSGDGVLIECVQVNVSQVVVRNLFEVLKRRVPAGKRIGRCHSEERGDEGLSVFGGKEENTPDMIGKTISH
jgi:hypothetical protein